MSRLALNLVALALVVLTSSGCGRSEPDAPAHPGRKITHEEYRKMSPEEKDDPYTKAHLEAPAPAKPRARP